VEDLNVSAAVKYIRDHLPEGLSVKQLVQHLPISRRALELAFRSHLGRTVHHEIVLAKLHRAARLLVDGHMTLAEVAAQCGLDHPSRLNSLLKQHTGMTPMQYRIRHQRKHF
jgi:LacI family transcriptional regulator